MSSPSALAVDAVPQLFSALRDSLAPPTLFVHLSALLGLSGFISSNVLMLRAFSILSSLSALAFNTWNGLRVPAAWNAIFVSINSLRISQLLRSQHDCLTLTPDESELYERAFLQFGVTPREFAVLLRESGATWLDYPSGGAMLAEQGDPMPNIWYILKGSVEVIRNGRKMRTINPCHDIKKAGGWIGELFDPNESPTYWDEPHHWHVGFQVNAGTRLVSFARRPLHDVIASRPNLREAATKAEVSDLWGKLRASMRGVPAHVYRGMLLMAEVDGAIDEHERAELSQYAESNLEVLKEQRLLDAVPTLPKLSPEVRDGEAVAAAAATPAAAVEGAALHVVPEPTGDAINDSAAAANRRDTSRAGGWGTGW